ncbi:hypothetical protein H5410_043293 [Solanum commersonii]|uniref:Uncharacterized protein n=1 Tax=Solanum commersonii TaxID=4109 RepID=A0A9J5XWS3_SOLCO|nr:hypothetical protein H5410_043293 [Solanum commersonii]
MILPDAHESLTSNPSVKAPIRVTRSVQRTRDVMLLAKSTKKTRPVQRSATSISSTVGGVSFTVNPEILSSILEERRLAYGFWFGMVFEHFGVPIGEWKIQTNKDILGVVNHETIPATKRGANAPMQRLRASLITKNEKITAQQGPHSTAMISCTLIMV